MLDPHIRAALTKAVQEFAQPEELATKIGAWMDEVAMGNERTEDPEAAARHLDRLFDAVTVPSEGSSDGE